MIPSASPQHTAKPATPASACASFRWWLSSRDVSAAGPLHQMLFGSSVSRAECGSNPNAPGYDPADHSRSFPE